jgi:hypothetical protein
MNEIRWWKLLIDLIYIVIDYYGITSDHRAPGGEVSSDVLQINIIEMDEEEGAYAWR